jgi:uncharacterized membrane protein
MFTMECAKCNAPDATPYEFTYAKRTGSTSTRSGNTTTTITRYQIGGTSDEHYCSACVSKQKRKMGITTIIGYLFMSVIGAMIFGLGLFTPRNGTFNYQLWLVIGIVAGLAIGFITAASRDDNEVGDTLAVKNNRQKVRGLGWDTLFTRKERAKLR